MKKRIIEMIEYQDGSLGPFYEHDAPPPTSKLSWAEPNELHAISAGNIFQMKRWITFKEVDRRYSKKTE